MTDRHWLRAARFEGGRALCLRAIGAWVAPFDLPWPAGVKSVGRFGDLVARIIFTYRLGPPSLIGGWYPGFLLKIYLLSVLLVGDIEIVEFRTGCCHSYW